MVVLYILLAVILIVLIWLVAALMYFIWKEFGLREISIEMLESITQILQHIRKGD